MKMLLKNQRGQQIGEYAAMVGIVATAFLSMQMYVSRRVAGGLVGASHAFIGNAAPAAGDINESNSLDWASERGGPTGVQTTTHSEGDGHSHSGFILAEAYGPYIVKSTTFADRPSLDMIVSAILAEYGDNASVSTLSYDPGTDDLTLGLDTNGDKQRDMTIKTKLGNYKVIEGSIKTDGIVITAMLDMDGNPATTADQRMVMAIPKDIAMAGGLVDAVILQDVHARRAWLDLNSLDADLQDSQGLGSLVSSEDKDKVAAGKQAAVNIRQKILAALAKAGLKPGSAADMEQMLTGLSPDALTDLLKSIAQEGDALQAAQGAEQHVTQKILDLVVPWSQSGGEGLIADSPKESTQEEDNGYHAPIFSTLRQQSYDAAKGMLAYLDSRESGTGDALAHGRSIREKAQHVLDLIPSGGTISSPSPAGDLGVEAAKEVDQAYDALAVDLGLKDDGKAPTPEETATQERKAQGQAAKLFSSVEAATPVTYQNPDGSLQPDAVGKVVKGAQDRAKIVGELQDIVKKFDGDGSISLAHFGDIKSHTDAAAAALQRQDIGDMDKEIAAAKDLLGGDLNEFFDVGRETTPASHDGHASLATLQRWEDRARKGNVLTGSSGTKGGVLIDRDGDQLPDVVRTGKDHGVVDGRYQTDEHYVSLDWMVAEPGDVANVTTEGRDSFGAALVLQIQAQDPALARQSGKPSAKVEPMENDGFTVEESIATGHAPIHYQRVDAFKRLSPGSVPAGATSIMDPHANQKGASQGRTTTPLPEPDKPGGPPKGKYNP